MASQKVSIRNVRGPVSFQVFIVPLTEDQAAELTVQLQRIDGVKTVRRVDMTGKRRDAMEITIVRGYEAQTHTIWAMAGTVAFDYQKTLPD